MQLKWGTKQPWCKLKTTDKEKHCSLLLLLEPDYDL